MIPAEIYSKQVKKPSFKLIVFNQKIEAEAFRNSQNHKEPLNSILVPRPLNYPKKQLFLTFLRFQGVISYRINSPKKFFLVFLVELQLYFTGYLKVYATVLLLTSKFEKSVPHLLNPLTPRQWKENLHNLKCP